MDDPKMLKAGYLVMGKAGLPNQDGTVEVKTWKKKWCVLYEATLYYYYKKTSTVPTDGMQVLKSELMEDVKTDKQFVFGLKHEKKGKTFVFSCDNEEERKEWEQVVKVAKDNKKEGKIGKVATDDNEEEEIQNNTQQHLPAQAVVNFEYYHQMENRRSGTRGHEAESITEIIPNPFASRKGKGLLYSLKTTAIASTVAKKAVKSKLGPHLLRLVDALCSFLAQAKGPDIARTFKKSFMLIATKVGLLILHETHEDEEISLWLRKFRKLGAMTLDFYQVPSLFNCRVLALYLSGMKSDMEDRMAPKLTQGSLARLRFGFDLLMDEALLTDLFQAKKWKELETIAACLQKRGVRQEEYA